MLIALKSQTKDEWHAIDLLSSVVIAVADVVVVVVVVVVVIQNSPDSVTHPYFLLRFLFLKVDFY